MVDVICPPPLLISSIVVSLWLAGCLAKSTLIGWREYFGGGGVGVDRHPANASIWPNAVSILAHRQRRWTNIETTWGRVFVFAGRAVRILIHGCRLCLVGTGSTVLCVSNYQLATEYKNCMDSSMSKKAHNISTECALRAQFFFLGGRARIIPVL